MLDWKRSGMPLTQGQPVAQRVLAGPDTETPARSPSTNGPAAATPQPAVDPQAIAQRVYELLRRDLRTWNARQGR